MAMLAEDVVIRRGAPPLSMSGASFSLALAASGQAPPSPAILGAGWQLPAFSAAPSRGTGRGQPVARGRRRGRSLPAGILVDLDPTTLIRWLKEAKGVDGISFTVHPLDGKLNPVRPLAQAAGAIDGSHVVMAPTAYSPML